MGARLMAVVAEGDRSRVYLDSYGGARKHRAECNAQWTHQRQTCRGTSTRLPGSGVRHDQVAGSLHRPPTGRTHHLLRLGGGSTKARIATPMLCLAGMPGMTGVPLRDGGMGSAAYAEAVGVYLAFAISKLADRGSTICTWFTERDSTRNTFARQSIPMTWDYAELNTLLSSTGSFLGAVAWTAESIAGIVTMYGSSFGSASQANATNQRVSTNSVVSTDPPYYDNIGYADLSDFFYVWLRRSLRSVFPDLFATLAVPKTDELVATPYRHGSKEKAEKFFLAGMTLAMQRLADQAHLAFPVTIYYAFKQSESRGDDRGCQYWLGDFSRCSASSRTWSQWHLAYANRVGQSDGWKGYQRPRLQHCSRMPSTSHRCARCHAAGIPRRPKGGVAGGAAPDAARQRRPCGFGPGRHRAGHGGIHPIRPSVERQRRCAVGAAGPSPHQPDLDEVLAEQEGDFDADTRWALAWFEHSGFAEGEYGIAETLSTAKNTSVAGMMAAGILRSGTGKVRLLRPNELPEDWVPDSDTRLIVWEAVHHLVRVHDKEGEDAAASLMSKLGPNAEAARELAYRLYRICDQKNRSQEALGYNALVQSWPEVARLAQQVVRPTQGRMGLPDDR